MCCQKLTLVFDKPRANPDTARSFTDLPKMKVLVSLH
jgi:hypothetical protein